jgi:amino acid adenylation domain-containing protein
MCAGCAHRDRVCVFAPKAPATIVGLLAALKAGCAYVPIDIASPARRVARIVRAADPAAALALGSAAGLIEELRMLGALEPSLPIVALDESASVSVVGCAFGPADAASEPDDPPPARRGCDDAAQILFTSGSTGEPKGVVVTHASVDAFIRWAVPYFGIGSRDRTSGHPPLHFDLSTFDVFGSFCAGAELHLVPPNTLLPGQLADFISGARLTQWFCVPSTMTYMANLGAVPEDGFPSLRRVLWCGEVLPTPVLAHWMRRNPQAAFTNLYGPTEATIASSHYTVSEVPADETVAIPIGTPCAGEELFVVTDRDELAAVDEIGELLIAGAGLSPGYWRDERTTRAAFVPDPRSDRQGSRAYRTGDLARRDRDGLLHFVGRTDSQVKSRGYRIELGEIEAALNALPAVGECAVVGVPSQGFEGTTICCALTPANGTQLPATTLRAELAASLPTYMLPSRWEMLDSLPHNGNGKIDRRRVRELFGAAA